MADKHLATSLKDTCIDYIVAHFQEVHLTAGFKELARELLELVHDGISARLDGSSAAVGLVGGGRGTAGGAHKSSGSPAGRGRAAV